MSRLLPHLPALHAVSADLLATLGGNSFAGREPSLAYHARIKLAPFDIDGAAQHTAVQLHSVPLGVRSWRGLAGRTYEFPALPAGHVMADGECLPDGAQASGAILLKGEHLPLACTRLVFGALEEGPRIAATFEIRFDLAKIGRPPTVQTLPVTVSLGGVRVVGDIALVRRPDLAEAEALAASWIDLGDYAPRLEETVVTFIPR